MGFKKFLRERAKQMDPKVTGVSIAADIAADGRNYGFIQLAVDTVTFGEDMKVIEEPPPTGAWIYSPYKTYQIAVDQPKPEKAEKDMTEEERPWWTYCRRR